MLFPFPGSVCQCIECCGPSTTVLHLPLRTPGEHFNCKFTAASKGDALSRAQAAYGWTRVSCTHSPASLLLLLPHLSTLPCIRLNSTRVDLPGTHLISTGTGSGSGSGSVRRLQKDLRPGLSEDRAPRTEDTVSTIKPQSRHASEDEGDDYFKVASRGQPGTLSVCSAACRRVCPSGLGPCCPPPPGNQQVPCIY